MFSIVEHAQLGGLGETNQTLSSLHRHLQQHTPMMRSNNSFKINNSRQWKNISGHHAIIIKDNLSQNVCNAHCYAKRCIHWFIIDNCAPMTKLYHKKKWKSNRGMHTHVLMRGMSPRINFGSWYLTNLHMQQMGQNCFG